MPFLIYYHTKPLTTPVLSCVAHGPALSPKLLLPTVFAQAAPVSGASDARTPPHSQARAAAKLALAASAPSVAAAPWPLRPAPSALSIPLEAPVVRSLSERTERELDRRQRVERYRQKRRDRAFVKKIRYEARDPRPCPTLPPTPPRCHPPRHAARPTACPWCFEVLTGSILYYYYYWIRTN